MVIFSKVPSPKLCKGLYTLFTKREAYTVATADKQTKRMRPGSLFTMYFVGI